jgi:hypothetical protein
MKQKIMEYIVEWSEKTTHSYFNGDEKRLFIESDTELRYTEEAQEYFNEINDKYEAAFNHLRKCTALTFLKPPSSMPYISVGQHLEDLDNKNYHTVYLLPEFQELPITTIATFIFDNAKSLFELMIENNALDNLLNCIGYE